MKKLCRVVGFTALAWAILVSNSYAFHDLKNGRYDLHSRNRGLRSLPFEAWPSDKLKIFNEFRQYVSGLGPREIRSAILIIIRNGLKDRHLVNPGHYLKGGGSVSAGTVLGIPRQIKRLSYTGIVFKDSYWKPGTDGILTYQIEGLNDRLAIMWAVPAASRTLTGRKNNWYNIRIIKSTGSRLDAKLYKSMYAKSKAGRKDGFFLYFNQRGFPQQDLKPHGYCILATMGRYDYPILDISIRSSCD